ncbi:YqjF family protein [Streptosporangium sandarakinum]
MSPSPPPPPRVDRPVMYHRWSHITFLHWRYPAELIQATLPPGLKADTFDGAAWVSLTPFLLEGVRPPGIPALPWLSRFPETNVRTYVRDERGRAGIWFYSLDAGRLPAVLGARLTYGLPYFWSDMAVRVDGARRRYRCRRHRPLQPGGHCHADVETGPPLDAPDEAAIFLTARYRLFTLFAGTLASAEVEHPPWPLHEARLERLDQSLVRAAGLPAPDRSPLLHSSPGVPVAVGMWHPVR